MSRFRKKPIVVEAEQWFKPDWEEHYSSKPDRLGVFWNFWDSKFIMNTLEGFHEVTSGDWIITGVKGERYPCKPDIFDITYELVEE